MLAKAGLIKAAAVDDAHPTGLSGSVIDSGGELSGFLQVGEERGRHPSSMGRQMHCWQQEYCNLQ